MCAGQHRNPAFFPDRAPPPPEKAGFLPVGPVCPVTTRQLFDLPILTSDKVF
ncbi:Uncharacterized protein dnm_028950 [Desulfonema magnum]|uniref:Uncharacterized protein n=1 Tax=Desulfonema magnum TaxID=45655 RepID=A0A975BK38_9BACT|nr:Uncharacterized protein dnm_028950 [Desulfonema magnum]